ncbi:hypothetical protein PPL_01461 [Heterostelium album PN500]|uniref:mRNA-decapping enzyme-like protein n=1 Tax=Heterostelium pallidum (strain ATCC 26659 / Pp 5 / PN500) TaxID=670386 RepID=D3AZC1_HETP5|nr:hypothetical protein PPL_01461 [Heterostelium album PN500]EFA85504.1 hypothetical protein PPL_01461 [Heterostelium album PN500]|eukprot:XP_020437612.1 hypothetical protein PPL_01461 [Heterostelium album PN500]
MNREAGSQQQLNLSALQRLDNKIVSVLGTSTHVAVYKFDESSLEWHRGEVEGSLFIVRRLEEPFERLVVLNRLSTKNLVEDINDRLLIKCQGPYLIYKSNNSINGIWFYEESEQPRIFNQLKDIQKQISARPPPTPVVVAVPVTPLPQQQQQQLQQQPLSPQPIYQPPPVQQQPPPHMMAPPAQMMHHQIPIPITQPPPPAMLQQQQPPPMSQQQQTAAAALAINQQQQETHLPILAKLMSSVTMNKPPGLHQEPPAIQAISVSSIESQHQYNQQPSKRTPQPAQQPTLTKDQLKEILKKLSKEYVILMILRLMSQDDQFINQVYSSYVSQSKFMTI